jgi:hypothetical protein
MAPDARLFDSLMIHENDELGEVQSSRAPCMMETDAFCLSFCHNGWPRLIHRGIGSQVQEDAVFLWSI